eukprot:GFYU01006435.1.p1 GENE.GFYU01006435.1~~GFYU01006435.1.p1  ORF type:complete len:548 (-),score=89.92 GFYU01006435.1:515-2158(-)
MSRMGEESGGNGWWWNRGEDSSRPSTGSGKRQGYETLRNSANITDNVFTWNTDGAARTTHVETPGSPSTSSRAKPSPRPDAQSSLGGVLSWNGMAPPMSAGRERASLSLAIPPRAEEAHIEDVLKSIAAMSSQLPRLKFALTRMDGDRDGLLVGDELTRGLIEQNVVLNKSQLNTLVREYNVSNDRVPLISIDNLMDGIKHVLERPGEHSRASTPRSPRVPPVALQNISSPKNQRPSPNTQGDESPRYGTNDFPPSPARRWSEKQSDPESPRYTPDDFPQSPSSRSKPEPPVVIQDEERIWPRDSYDGGPTRILHHSRTAYDYSATRPSSDEAAAAATAGSSHPGTSLDFTQLKTAKKQEEATPTRKPRTPVAQSPIAPHNNDVVAPPDVSREIQFRKQKASPAKTAVTAGSGDILQWSGEPRGVPGPAHSQKRHSVVASPSKPYDFGRDQPNPITGESTPAKMSPRYRRRSERTPPPFGIDQPPQPRPVYESPTPPFGTTTGATMERRQQQIDLFEAQRSNNAAGVSSDNGKPKGNPTYTSQFSFG